MCVRLTTPLCPTRHPTRAPGRAETVYDLQWRARPAEITPPEFVATLSARPEVTRVRWRPLT